MPYPVAARGLRANVQSALLFYDTFTDTDGVLLEAHVPNVGSAAWVDVLGDWDINSNAARPGQLNPNVTAVDVGVADVDIQVTVNVLNASRGGVTVRLTDASNRWFIGSNGSTAFEISEINGGTETTRATATVADGNGVHTLWVRCQGTRIDAVWDGATAISYSGATLNQTATKHGLQSRYQSFHLFDNFSVYRAGATSSPIEIYNPLNGMYDYIPLSEASGNRTSTVRSQVFGPSGAGVGAAAGLVYTNAAQFVRGDSTYLQATDVSYANFTSQAPDSWTIAACVYLDSWGASPPPETAYSFPYGRGGWLQTDGGYGALLRYSNQLVTHVAGGGACHGGGGLATGAWRIIRQWYDANTNKHYNQIGLGTIYEMDGEWTGASTSSSVKLFIGNDGNGEYWMDGRVGPIVIWNRVLSIGEWTWMYNNGAFRAYDAL